MFKRYLFRASAFNSRACLKKFSRIYYFVQVWWNFHVFITLWKSVEIFMRSIICANLKKFSCIHYFVQVWRKCHVFVTLCKSRKFHVIITLRKSEEILMCVLLCASLKKVHRICEKLGRDEAYGLPFGTGYRINRTQFLFLTGCA
jgi:hypothetical protein